jgi:hypothetical protein
MLYPQPRYCVYEDVGNCYYSLDLLGVQQQNAPTPNTELESATIEGVSLVAGSLQPLIQRSIACALHAFDCQFDTIQHL